jgi:hypothetical protein
VVCIAQQIQAKLVPSFSKLQWEVVIARQGERVVGGASQRHLDDSTYGHLLAEEFVEFLERRKFTRLFENDT